MTDMSDPLLPQSVNEQLFEMLLRNHFAQFETPVSQRASTELCMKKDELNVLQYACGYVPHTLLKKYEKKKGEKYDRFVECLGNMAVRSENEHDDLFSYTKECINKVDRGGLFPINEKKLYILSYDRKTGASPSSKHDSKYINFIKSYI